MIKTIGLLLLSLLLQSCRAEKTVPLWGIFESEVRSNNSYTNPFRDVDLLVRVTRPDGSHFNQYGFFDGQATWKFRIMPGMEGKWKYRAEMTDSSAYLEREFTCVKGDLNGPLEPYDNNPVWPAYCGFNPVQIRCFHTGDRFFASNFSDKERKRFLDWVQQQGYNMLSVGSHYLNRQQTGRGNGWQTPRLWPPDPDEYRRMESILSELEKRNIYIHPFAGFFGRAAEWPVDHDAQELYIRYTLARIGAFRNIILNVGGPEPLLKPEEYQNGNMTRADINRVALLIKKHDTYSHMLSVHNRTGNGKGDYEQDPFIYEKWEDYSTLQGAKSTDLDETYKFITESRKIVKPVFAHEVMWYGNMYHEGLDPETLRKKAITLIMAGAFINFGDMNGNSSSGFSGCLNPDSASLQAHRIIKTVWDIFDALPFYELTPIDSLVDNAFCMSDGSGKHLIYSPHGDSFSVKFPLPVSGRWISPADGTVKPVSISSCEVTPPDKNDWILYINGESKP